MLSAKLSTSLTCVYTSASIHIQNVASIMGFIMPVTAKARKQFILPIAKIRKAKKILSAKTDTEAVERALDLVIADAEIRNMLLSAKGRANIDDVYGRLAR
jgi:hypothetical protein